MQDGLETDRRLKTSACLVAEIASLYRAIMQELTRANARLAVHLRPAEIVAALLDGQ